ncbi:hypothetical protein PFICI_04051 [Pestalotiopsis fici W106-1]|uniref:Uncharacterized protein n=1 Tax=Pestalotiopsis fici (strain W106-1 / CGMCC3.15140) TaxID=1229662 RepID=W3XL79_PESFW|nr:uncharacterized protein PFICI_04051 [Pestalotiopsis fici W106-1]ETS86026.1 hypothetical protein PFICI_04051 [Pestalotiopsis fici W106-1]
MGATPTLPPSITWLHHLGSSAEGQTRMTAELFRQAPIKLIYEPFPPNPTLHPKVLAAIMDSGQDLNAEEESNRSIMLVAMHNPETATLILNQPAQLTETGPFPWSMIGSMIEDVSWMNQHWKHYLRRFRMEDLRRVSNLEPRRGWSPLCLATCTDAVKVMEHCLEMGTDIDFEGSPYGSALMAAAGMNRIESVKFLVRHGASICYEGKEGFTSAVVVGASSQRVVQWLLVGRFQDQGKLEAVSESSTIITENVPIHSWSPARLNFRLAGKFERQPDESSLDYLKALAEIKKNLRGQVVHLPKPEYLETSVVTAVYDI